VSATRAIGLEFAGVDVMLHASGRAYVLEANFPCYFGHAQGDGAIDVAGAMVAHLLDKAR
jgi:glutathione synthase/RimK-type ligase-like ATP-grasp enzyme